MNTDPCVTTRSVNLMTETLIQIPPHNLVIGVDGGGSATVAVVARRDTGTILGKGSAGPSNIQSVGIEASLSAINAAVDQAFEAANTPRTRVRAACLGLAGIDWDGGADVIRAWAKKVDIAVAVTVTNDSTLLLAAGTPQGWGLAIVCGTGSIAYARASDGRESRCGGWGYLLGDEGSGYQLALNALKAVCRAFDCCGPTTRLTHQLLHTMNLKSPPELINAVYQGAWNRAAISALAPIVLQTAADGDRVAKSIVDAEARNLARTAASALRNLDIHTLPAPVALSGGVVLENDHYRQAVLSALESEGIVIASTHLVDEPVLGAVIMAQQIP